MRQQLESACTHTELRTAGGLVIHPGCRTPATPTPADFFPPLLREGVAAEGLLQEFHQHLGRLVFPFDGLWRKLGDILEHYVSLGECPFSRLVASVGDGHYAHTPRLGGQDAVVGVLHCDSVLRIDAQTKSGLQVDIRGGLAVLDLLRGDSHPKEPIQAAKLQDKVDDRSVGGRGDSQGPPFR
jgi:hypothetical protein